MSRFFDLRKWMWLGIFLGFWWVGVIGLDPDYGWHLGMGKFIWKSGIPETDPFSYTMPSYPFVDHEWLLNILMYLGDTLVGKNGLAFVFAFLATRALYPVNKKAGYQLGVLLAAAVLAGRAGVRPQVLDWLLIGCLWQGISNIESWNKQKWYWVGIMFLWVNLHGGFVIGLAIWLWIQTTRWMEDNSWRSDVSNWWAWIGGLVVTIINPYGIRIWWEIWMQLSDRQLTKYIAEWQPFYATVEPALWFLALLLGMLYFQLIKRKEMQIWRMSTLFMALIAGLSSIRHAGIFVVLASFELSRVIDILYEKYLDKQAKIRGVLIYKLFTGVAIVLWLLATVLTAINYYRGAWRYPDQAIKFLKENKFEGNVFAEYGWGGYLIWNYPEKKVFIDGRMPSWRWLGPESESNNAMKDYLTAVKDKQFENIFEKYNIEVVLITAVLPPDLFENIKAKLVNKYLSFLGMAKPTEIQFTDKLLEHGWKKVYIDEIAEIYAK